MSEESDPVAWFRTVIESDLALARRLKARWVVPADHPARPAGEPVWPAASVEALMVFRGEDPDVNAGLDLIRLFGPAQVADDCESKLAILDEHAPQDGYQQPEGDLTPVCTRCADDRMYGYAYPCRTVRLLGSGYRRRPGCPAAFASTAGSRS